MSSYTSAIDRTHGIDPRRSALKAALEMNHTFRGWTTTRDGAWVATCIRCERTAHVSPQGVSSGAALEDFCLD